MISEVFKSDLLTSSDFYKELKSKGNLLYSSTTKEDDLNKAYLSFIKSRVKKEFIDLYLADSGLKSEFEQIFKRHSFVRYYVAVAQRPNRLKILESPLKV